MGIDDLSEDVCMCVLPPLIQKYYSSSMLHNSYRRKQRMRVLYHQPFRFPLFLLRRTYSTWASMGPTPHHLMPAGRRSALAILPKVDAIPRMLYRAKVRVSARGRMYPKFRFTSEGSNLVAGQGWWRKFVPKRDTVRRHLRRTQVTNLP